MNSKRILFRRKPAFLLLLLLLLAQLLPAQRDRLGRIDPERLIALKGSLSPSAGREFDRGPVDSAQRISGMMLMLKRSPMQQEELEKLLVDQQDPSSPAFHDWLTPEEFANRFAASEADLDRIKDWLSKEGFSIDNEARAHNWILFSGTAGQIHKTFRTEIHNYLVDGKMHYANATNPSVPEALDPLVLGINGLTDLPKLRRGPAATLNPKYNGPDGSHFLAPADIATIYNIAPLHAKGFDGSGQKLAVLGQTDIKSSDVDLFRATYGLPAGSVQKTLVKGSDDPGIVQSDFVEANIDLDWTTAVAPKATILYVYAKDLWDAVGYAIDQNVAPVMSLSYTVCEAKASDVPAQTARWFQGLAQQANAQGITWVSASGDAGVAACDARTPKIGMSGIGVNLPASVPEVTAVGGTEFSEGSGRYWGSANGSNKGSALGYIPEIAWNDSDESEMSATGGGASIIFSKPSWQTGPGVPNDHARDLPDISFDASSAHNPYCIALNGEAVCGWGGTSVATPVFAGALTLLNQYQVASGAQTKPGLGNINPKLYSLAQSNPGIFHDITVGSNIVACSKGTPDCTSGSYGYKAGQGYDLVTGLGSADVYNLVTQWSAPASNATTTSVTANPANIATGASTTVTATVKANGATPTGSVSFSSGSKSLGSANLSGSGGTATASITVAGNQLTAGSNSIKANYGGDTGFNPSSGGTAVTVGGDSGPSPVVASVDPNPVYQHPADKDGYSWYYTVTISETAGKSATITGFSIDDTDYSANIATWFGSATLPAHGKLSVGLRSNVDTVPGSEVFRFTGVDANGSKWTQEVTVQFLGKAPSASMVLSSIPEVVKAKAEGTTGCPQGYPFYQVLSLKERYGYAVSLSKFLAGGNDFSDAIKDWFGSSQLPATGELQTVICWTLDGPFPETLDYEVDGTDSGGNKVSAKLSVQFQTGPDLNQPSGVARPDTQPAARQGGRRPARAWISLPGEFGR